MYKTKQKINNDTKNSIGRIQMAAILLLRHAKGGNRVERNIQTDT